MKKMLQLLALMAMALMLVTFACKKDKSLDKDPDGDKPPITGTNDGSKQNPYTVAEGIEKQGGADTLWIEGYIVGTVIASVASSDSVRFEVPFQRVTNVLIADNATETDFNNCIAVNLPSGSSLRSEVNLVDNPTNKGKKLAVRGKLRAYFGIAGCRDSKGTKDWFILDGNDGNGNTDSDFAGIDPEPTKSLAEPFEEFLAGTDVYMGKQKDSKGWRGKALQGTLQPDVRTYNNNNYVQFSAHRNSITTAIAQEMWLISPRLDLDKATNKTISFETAGGYFNDNTEFKLYVIDSENPTTANKVELTGWRLAKKSDLLAGQSYTPFIPSGNISLEGHTGVKRIAFCYKGTSGAGNSTTFQLDNFTFAGGVIQTFNVTPTALSFAQEGENKDIT
ncbi:MAG: DUF6359 domain-containing protein, partial [Bacteroidales bacterium]